MISSCTKTQCPLHARCTFVPPAGDATKQFMIIGEQPGENEVAFKAPFVGASGRLLDKTLEVVGLKREQFYLTNAIKCYTAEKPPSEVATLCLDHLHYEVKTLKPKAILAVGSVASQAILGKGVTDIRGFVYSLWGTTQVICTYHPAAIFRMPEDFDLFIRDLYKFKRVVQGTYNEPDLKWFVADSIDKVRGLKDLLLSAPEISFDIETVSFELGQRVLCVSFAIDSTTGFVVPWEETGEVHELLKQILESPIPKIGQNVGFDIAHLRLHGIHPQNVRFDTMVAHHLLRSYLPHDLDALLSIYTDYPKYDDALAQYRPSKATTFDQIPPQVLYKYSAFDASGTFAVKVALEEELKKDPMVWALFQTISMPLVDTLADLRLRGVRIDRSLASKVRQDVDTAVTKLSADIRQYAGKEINLDSPKQLCEFLYGTLRLPIKGRTKSGAPSTDEKTLLSLKDAHPAIKALLELRTQRTLQKTFVSDKFFSRLDSRDRIHTDYKIAGTVTGRLSSVEPNLQNIPRGSTIRQLFTVEPGYKFIQMDYQQAELRAAAYFSHDSKLIQAFASGQDIHRQVAAEIFGKAESEITKEERVQAKFVSFGKCYGRGWESVADQFNLSEEKARAILRRFDDRFPTLSLWFREQISKAKRDRNLQNAYGRRRWFPIYGDFLPAWEREALNFIPQSVVADTAYRAMSKITGFLRPYKTKLIMNLHDALMFEVADTEYPIIKELQKIMEEVVPGMNAPIPVDLEISDRWGGEKIKLAI